MHSCEPPQAAAAGRMLGSLQTIVMISGHTHTLTPTHPRTMRAGALAGVLLKHAHAEVHDQPPIWLQWGLRVPGKQRAQQVADKEQANEFADIKCLPSTGAVSGLPAAGCTTNGSQALCGAVTAAAWQGGLHTGCRLAISSGCHACGRCSWCRRRCWGRSCCHGGSWRRCPAANGQRATLLQQGAVTIQMRCRRRCIPPLCGGSVVGPLVAVLVHEQRVALQRWLAQL